MIPHPKMCGHRFVCSSFIHREGRATTVYDVPRFYVVTLRKQQSVANRQAQEDVLSSTTLASYISSVFRAFLMSLLGKRLAYDLASQTR